MSAALKQFRVKSSALAEVGPATSYENIKAEATLQLQISRVNGMTPLMHAVCDDSVDVVRTLLDCGADVNAKRNDGFTALALAAFFGRTSIVKLLLERGADVRVVTRFGTSPEMWAKARGFREIVDLLRGVPQVAISKSQVSVIPEQDVALTPEENHWLDGSPLTVPRTLPEIHDPPPLIGPAFHPGRAFIARVTSDRRSLAALTVALFVTLGLAIFATYQIGGLLRDGKQTVSTDKDLAVQPQAAAAQPDKTRSAQQEPGSPSEVTTDLPDKAAPGPNDESTASAAMVKPSIKILPTQRLSHSSVPTPKRDTVTRSEQPKQSAELETDSRPAPLTVEVSREPNTSPAPVTHAADPPPSRPAPLGITSSKPRTKVIQWP